MFSLDSDARTNLASAAVCCAAMTDNLRTMMGYKPGQKTSPPAFLQAVASALANGDLTFRDKQAAARFFHTYDLMRVTSITHSFKERLELAGLAPESDPREAA